MTTATELAPCQTVGEAIHHEIARVRHELIPAYEAIGPAGIFGVLMLNQVLERAEKALASGDVVAVLRSFKELQECK